jgi:hypothetical protein
MNQMSWNYVVVINTVKGSSNPPSIARQCELPEPGRLTYTVALAMAPDSMVRKRAFEAFSASDERIP